MNVRSEAPLAARMRLPILDKYINREHISEEGKLLWRAIKAGCMFPSILLWNLPHVDPSLLQSHSH